MTEKKLQQMKAIRWDEADWGMLATLAAKVGLTRSAFIKQATLGEAARILAGGVPYFVGGGPEATTTQNTRTNISGPLSVAKGAGDVGAGSRRRRRGVAKGAEEEATKKRGPQV
jgi:hypothetical protein